MSATEQQKSCPHEDFNAHVAVGRIIDIHKFVADITVSCAQCGLPFRFVGVGAGISYEKPMCNITGVELHAPIEPEHETLLFQSATFHVGQKGTVQ